MSTRRQHSFSAALATFLAPLASSQQLYWADNDFSSSEIWYAEADGSGTPHQIALAGQRCPHSLAIDECAEAAFWTNACFSPGTGGIYRTVLDGTSNAQLVIDTKPFLPIGIALDPAARRLYWTEADAAGVRRISTASLTDLQPSVLVVDSPTTPLTDPIGIQVDHVGGRIYWADYDGHCIGHANLDGSVPAGWPTTILFDLRPGGEPEGLAIDRARQRIYWADANVFGGQGIGCGPLNGVGPPDYLPTDLVYSSGAITMDPVRDMLYFDSEAFPTSAWEIREFDLATHSDTSIHDTLIEFHGTMAIDLATVGSTYCAANANSTGFPAELSACGSASVSTGDLVLTSMPVPNQNGIFFHGMNQVQVAFGNGFQCAGGGIVRGAVVSSAGNAATYAYDNSDPKHSLAAFIGSTRHFQHWFRDPMGGGALFNTSNATSIPVLP